MLNDVFALIDREYRQEVEWYRAEFAKAVDRTNPDSLRRWFVAHPYLTSNDHCRIAQVSLKTLQRWRRQVGQAGCKRTPPRRWQLPRSAPVAPANWQTGTWLEEQYPRYSIRLIASAIGRSYSATRRELGRRGVQFRSAREAVRSRHPCCTRGWLVRHYLELGLSLVRCARLARVSSSTMTNWLLQFEIRIRSVAEQLYLNARVNRHLHHHS